VTRISKWSNNFLRKTASQTVTAETAHSPDRIRHPPNINKCTVFWAYQVHTPSGISIGSSVVAQLMAMSDRHTHIRTDRPCNSVAVGRILHSAHAMRPKTVKKTLLMQCLFQTSFFLGGGESPPQKNLQLSRSQMAAKLCALNFFSAGTMNYNYVTETFF